MLSCSVYNLKKKCWFWGSKISVGVCWIKNGLYRLNIINYKAVNLEIGFLQTVNFGNADRAAKQATLI